MLANSVLWNVRHPRHYLPENYYIYLAQDGRTELEGRFRKDNRPWIIKHFDPFGIFAQKKQEDRRFWELDDYSSANRQD